MQYLRLIALSVGLVAMPAMAQQATVQGASPDFLQHALAAMHDQRNAALDDAVVAKAQLAQAQQQIADLQKQIADKSKDEPKQ